MFLKLALAIVEPIGYVAGAEDSQAAKSEVPTLTGGMRRRLGWAFDLAT